MTERGLLEAFLKTMDHFYPKFTSKWLGKVPDPRNPKMITYKLQVLLLEGIFLFLFKLKSRRNINFKLATEELTKNLLQWLRLEGEEMEDLKRIAHGDTVEYLLEKLTSQNLANLRTSMIRRLVRMRALEKARLFGKYYLIVIDATWVLRFKKEHCEHCLRMKTGIDKDGQPVFVYYHPVLEAKLVTENGLAFSIATEFIENIALNENDSFEKQKQDCELKAFYRLALKLKAAFPQLNICLLLDGLYAGKPVFDICENNSWKYIVTFKEGSMPATYTEFEALKKLAPENATQHKTEGVTQDFRWVTDLDYEEHKLNVLECEENIEEKKTRFVWLTNFLLTKNNVEILANKGGRCRWKIENEGFNMQKNGGYELEHPYSLNNTAIKNYYFLLQIAHIRFAYDSS